MTSRSAPGGEPRGDCRCLCGNLLARVSRDGVELKCRRCKRTLLVPLQGSGALRLPERVPARFAPVRERG